MKTILQELAILPGVVGSCISVRNEGTLGSSLPDFFTESMANEASNNISRMMQMARVKNLDPQTMSIKYDKFELLAMPINEISCLLVLCEPGNSTSLVTTTACMLAPELEKMLAQQADLGKTIKTKTSPEDEQATRYNKRRMAKSLEQIKEALFGTVGPIADMVYNECLEQWTAESPSDISRLPELMDYICEEIDNEELFDEFKGKIATLF